MRVLLLIFMLLGAVPAVADTPRVVVTLKPVHALIADIMAGLGEPHLLLSSGADPHHHALRPSEARALAQAQAVFWIGPALEGYLQKPLASLASGASVIALSETPGLRLLPAREGGLWRRAADHDHDHDHGHDPHIWLDPRNAQAMVRQAVGALTELDPANGAGYRRNGDRVIAGLSALEAEIHKLLAPVRPLPYLVLHDAYQYFESRFGTNAQGAIAIAPDRKPGARRISAIRKRLARSQDGGRIRCLFGEARYPARLLETLTAGLDVRTASLDPIGLAIAPGPDAYGRILRQLAGSIENCLSYSIGP
ncbi:MAG: zinc ABC transporter substrate-binding protein [Alphaproteobacteria bacterium]|jgi:zinc transport system substrate-binding protein|nr:zinc ABC transporter substrate-binding protein [Alphaproteobacteria bacterium]